MSSKGAYRRSQEFAAKEVVARRPIEAWFGILTRPSIRRGSFHGVRARVAAIDAFTNERNDRAAPFAWVETADEILAKAVRKTKNRSDASR